MGKRPLGEREFERDFFKGCGIRGTSNIVCLRINVVVCQCVRQDSVKERKN